MKIMHSGPLDRDVPDSILAKLPDSDKDLCLNSLTTECCNLCIEITSNSPKLVPLECKPNQLLLTNKRSALNWK